MQKISYIFICLLFIYGCGPKAVGQDVEPARVSGVGYAAADTDHLRYPVSGKNIDKKLYLLNKPESMVYLQNYTDSYLKQKAHKGDAPNNYDDLQPRHTSPFRW